MSLLMSDIERISVVFLWTCLFTSWAQSPGIVYLGCYADYPNPNPVLPIGLLTSTSNTPEECASRCSEYRYAGVQKWYYCFCGNTFQSTQMPESYCDHICSGDKNKYCGGSWKLSIYTNWACGPAPTIAHGRATLRQGTNVTYGSIADVYCEPGFIGQSTVICLSNKSWEYAICEQIAPKCTIGTLEVRNGVVSCVFTGTGLISCTARCNDRYHFYENPALTEIRITCSAGGEWNRAVPVCTVMHDSNARTTLTLHYSLGGNSVEQSCTNLYQFQASNVLVGLGVEFKKLCSNALNGLDLDISSPSDAPVVAILDPSSLAVNMTFDIRNPGLSDTTYQSCFNEMRNALNNRTPSTSTIHQLQGGSGCMTLTLTSGNTTDKRSFICSGQETAVQYNSTMHVCMVCPPGTYSSNQNCMPCPEGTYNDQFLSQCVGCPPESNSKTIGASSVKGCYACGPPPTIAHGNATLRQVTNVTYGSIADVYCEPGFIGQYTIICLSNNSWEHATCEQPDCGSPLPIVNGRISLLQHSNTSYGTQATVICNLGFSASISQVKCMANGQWGNASCKLMECGLPPTLASGSIKLLEASNTTYGALAEVNCTPGYDSTKHIIQCTPAGEWEDANCELHDCGPLDSLQHGVVQTPDGTTFGKTAVLTCKPGYTNVGLPDITCLSTGWSLNDNICVVKDCGQLKQPTQGQVDITEGSAYQAVARYMCNQGYELIGDETRVCQATGTWSGIQPTCLLKEQLKVVCRTNVDSRGTEWKEVIKGTTRVQQCVDTFLGNVTRTCLDDGTWQLPQYNCVRQTVTTVAETVETFYINATAYTISNALKQIANITGNAETNNTSGLLTDAEITVLASSLNTVADIVMNKSLPSPDVVKAFFQSVSNLVDEQNKESWETMKQTKNNGGEQMLASVDKIGIALRGKVESGEEGFTNITIVQKNVALEVKKVQRQDIVFPYADIKTDQPDDQNWIKTSESSIRLDAQAFGDNAVTMTVVIYKDMTHILPNALDTNTRSNKNDQEIHGPMLSLSLSNYFGLLDPPVLLTFERMKANLTSPVCSYWTYGRNNGTGYWANDGCVLQRSDETKTVCRCNHLTNFAVLMSPFVEADSTSVPLRTVSTVGIGISMACLLITMMTYIYLWRFLKSDRVILLLNLCGALLMSYIIFLAGVDKTANKALCTATALFLHYIYLVVFCLMLSEGIDIAIMVVYVFATKSRLKPLLISAWVSPAVIVAISLMSTQADGYGNERFCWLSLERGLIWAFVAPALLIILFNILCLILVMRNMFHMKAMENKTSTEKIKTSMRSLCVLVPLIGISWILGIFYVNESAVFMQYLFALFNTLQGLFIFIFHCIFNQQVRIAVKNVYNKREHLKSIERSTSQKTSTFNKMFKSSNNMHSEQLPSTSQHELSENKTVGPQMNVFSILRAKILSKKKTKHIGKKCEDPIPFSRESSLELASVVLRAVRFTDRYSRMEGSHSTKSDNETVTQV